MASSSSAAAKLAAMSLQHESKQQQGKHKHAHRDIDLSSDDDDDDEQSATTIVPSNSNVLLAFCEPPAHPNDLLAPYFPSKAGGRPAWLNPQHLPDTASQLTCKTCSKPLRFLLQLYAPLRKLSPSAFHRSLYVFTCDNTHCITQPQSLVCYRSQLPLDNPYYSTKPMKKCAPIDSDDDYPDVYAVDEAKVGSAKVCVVCGLSAKSQCSGCKSVSYCSQHHQRLDWRGGHNTECATLKAQTASAATAATTAAPSATSTSASTNTAAATPAPTDSASQHKLALARQKYLFKQHELVIEHELDAIDDSSHSKGDEFSREKQLYEQYKKQQTESKEDDDMSEAEGDSKDGGDDDLFDNHKPSRDAKDRTFTQFQQRVKHAPDQCVRYDLGGRPLWATSNNQIMAADVPRCEHCGATRSFEFQVTPQLLYFLDVDDKDASALDFGTIVVFSCSNSCGDGTKQYFREYVHIQPAALGGSVPK